MDTNFSRYPGIPVEFENDYVREFLSRFYAGELGPEITKKINDGNVRINDIQIYKRMAIHGKSSVCPLILSSDTMADGVTLFNSNKIPKDANFLLTHISIKHAFTSAPTTDPPSNAQLAASYYHNIVSFKVTDTNAAAGTARTIATIRDTDQINRIPEELLSADLTVTIGGILIFKRDVRSMMFDQRGMQLDIDTRKGIELTKKIMVKEDQVINAFLNFPNGVTMPAYSSGTTSHLCEFTLWGVGTSVKG